MITALTKKAYLLELNDPIESNGVTLKPQASYDPNNKIEFKCAIYRKSNKQYNGMIEETLKTDLNLLATGKDMFTPNQLIEFEGTRYKVVNIHKITPFANHVINQGIILGLVIND